MSLTKEEREATQTRLNERFSVAQPLEVLTRVPDENLRDITLNIARTLDGELAIFSRSDRLLVGFAVASSKGKTQCAFWLKEAAKAAGKTEEECEAARAVALTCKIYNGYYKFRSMIQQEAFEQFAPALRASPFVKSLLSKQMVELICIPISVLEGCSYCVKGHVKSAQEAGSSSALIDEVVRIGAVIGALAEWETGME